MRVNKRLKKPVDKLLVNDDFIVEKDIPGYYTIRIQGKSRRWIEIAGCIGTRYTKEGLHDRLLTFKRKGIELSLETEMWMTINK